MVDGVLCNQIVKKFRRETKVRKPDLVNELVADLENSLPQNAEDVAQIDSQDPPPKLPLVQSTFTRIVVPESYIWQVFATLS